MKKQIKNTQSRTGLKRHATHEGPLSFITNYLAESEEKIKKNPRKQFTWFVLGFVFFYLVLSGIVYLVPAILFESTAGVPLNALLSAQGLAPTISTFNGTEGIDFALLVQGKTIVISWLCAGALEIIILISAILASFGVSWRKKLIGAAIAIPLGYLFNLARVWITANIILTQNVQTIEFTHDLLFRLVLFVYIVAFYVLWFNWAMKKK